MDPQPPHSTAQSDSLTGLEWPRLWSALAARLATTHGGTAARALGFLDDISQIRASLAAIGEMMALQSDQGKLDFGGVQPIEPLLQRVEKHGPLETGELLQVLQSQRAAVALAQALSERPRAPALNALAPACLPEAELLDALGAALTEGGELNEQTFPELGRLRRELSRKRDAIHKHLEAMSRSSELADALREKIHTLRGGRYVLPVKADFKGRVPGIVHDVSASGATLFVEPHAVVDESNALTLVEKRIEARRAEILAGLSERVGASAGALRSNLGWLGRVDLIHAQATLALDYHGSVPAVEAEGGIALRQVANPLMLLEGEAPVRNDFTLGGDAHCMVISGANAGGKTVLLKTVGLCALLVRAGMPLPAAPGSRCDLFTDVRADIGDQQSLVRSLSTFSAQIRFMADTLSAGGPRSLVLIDEILTATAPAEGAALAVTLLEALAARGMRCIVTTHYGELKELAARHAGMVNASVAFDLDKLAPTYRLLMGTPGASYAFPIARRHGLEQSLVEEARGRLEERPAEADALLAQLHRQEQELTGRRTALTGREQALADARKGMEAREKALGEREWDVRRRERGAIGKEVEAARRRIAGVIAELQGANSLPLAGKVRRRLDEVAEELLAPPAGEEGTPPPLAAGELTPGDTVLIRSLNRLATLSEVLPRGRRARVQLGSLAMEVDVAELASPPHPPSPAGDGHGGDGHGGPAQDGSGRGVRPNQGSPRGGKGGEKGGGKGGGAPSSPAGGAADIAFILSNDDNTLDLRGLSLSVALERTEAFCDLCVVKYVSPVVLIHGHGTGKLKAGIRGWLKDNPYVAGFRPGGSGEGRDGVTVVALNL